MANPGVPVLSVLMYCTKALSYIDDVHEHGRFSIIGDTNNVIRDVGKTASLNF
jgi:hypothetical protein